jgi:hypothetical protein
MIWYILITLFIILLTWLLVGPIILKLNTEQNHYQLMLPGIINARVVPSEGLSTIRGWIFFVPFRLDLSKLKRGKGKKKEEKDKKKKKVRNTMKGVRMIRSVPGAFRVRRLWMDLDTDDFMLNAWLIPVFSTLNNERNIQMQVNFEGKLSMDLDLRTRMGSWLYIIRKNR